MRSYINKKSIVLILLIISSVSFFSITTRTDFKEEYRLIIFEGSDWCLNCRRLEKRIISDSVFINFLKSNKIVLERIDFPQRKKLSHQQVQYNEEIAKRYGFRGVFPTLVLSKSDTLKYKRIFYNKESDVDSMKEIVLGALNELL